MPKVSVYLPDDLYARARERGISLSAVTQAALQRELQAADVDRWLDAQRARPSRRLATTMTTEELMDAVDEEIDA